MVDENNRAASEPAPPGSAPAAGTEPASPVNGPPAPLDEGPTAPGTTPSAPTEGVAPGAPPIPAAGEQIRAGEAPAAAVPLSAPQGAAAEKGKEPPPEIKDGFREVVETIVFVVVLVLLLKAFLAEAFVIPTGSMAPTLLGYHRNVTCPQCHYPFAINMSPQLDPEREANEQVTGCTCPNCFEPFRLPRPK